MVQVTKNTAASRYEAVEDGAVVGYADYVVSGDVVVLPHTFVPPAIRGRGVAGDLVRAALDDIRSSGLGVDPRCWYVAGWIQRHPDYADLVPVTPVSAAGGRPPRRPRR